jgi:coumaroylquinate(coumaroylshikimate) 3'-monooxygenase
MGFELARQQQTSWLLAGVVLAGAAYILSYVTKKKLPPGPRGWPIVGNLYDIRPLPHHALAKMASEYGPIMTIWMGQQRTIVLSNPGILKDTLRDQGAKFSHRWLTDFAKLSLHADEEGGKNVALANGKYWSKSRKIFVQELMNMKFIRSKLYVIQEEVDSFVDAIKNMDGKPFDPHTWLQRLSLNIVMRLTYNIRYGRGEVAVDSKMSELLSVINSIVKLGATGVMSNYVPILKIFNGGLKKQRKELIARRDKILLGFLEDHKKTIDVDDPKDFLDVLISRQEKENLSDWEVTLIAWEFITAGTDTTSATMHWLIGLLANHPEVQRKAHAEIDAVCSGRRITVDDQKKLPYVDAVIKEAMRLYPVVPLMVPYNTIMDVTVRGYHVPKNTQVLVNQYAMARNDDLWENPAEFDPSRFLGREADVELRAADAPNDERCIKFIPMGTGRRACAGYSLAKAELFMQGSALMQCFFWSPPEGQEKLDLKEKFGIAVSPHDFDVSATFRPIAGSAAGKTLA